MARKIHQQRRDRSGPSHYQQSSNSHGDARPPRTSRPRLNRATVDRAWEEGAPTNHADYRARPSQGRPAQRNNSYTSSRNPGERDTSRRPYQSHNFNRTPRSNENYQDDSYGSRERFSSTTEENRQRRNGPPFRGQRSTYSSHAEEGSRPRRGSQPFRPERFSSREDEEGSRPRRGNQPFRPERFSSRRDEEGSHPRRGSQPSRPERSSSRRDEEDRSRSRRGQFRDQRPRFSNNEENRDFRRDEGHSRNRRSSAAYQEEKRSPRYDKQSIQQRHAPWLVDRDTTDDEEQFEGDYEYFEQHDEPAFDRSEKRSPARFKGPRPQHTPAEERHVTRLPDGRVLKGSRPAQRRKAEFWTGVTEDTDELMNRVQTPTQDSSHPGADSENARNRSSQEMPASRGRANRPKRSGDGGSTHRGTKRSR